MSFRNFLPLTALACAVFVLSACGDDDDDNPPDETVTATSAAASPSAITTVETPAGTPGVFTGSTTPGEGAAPAGLGQATVRDIRAAAQTGFDRLVFEFNGSQVPGYSVKYGDKAVACGSGADLTDFIGGGSAPGGVLLIDIRPAVAHDESGNLTAVRDLTPNLGSLERAFRLCDFEGVVGYGAAISDEQPFKVTTLTDPPRLVIDIASRFRGRPRCLVRSGGALRGHVSMLGSVPWLEVRMSSRTLIIIAVHSHLIVNGYITI